MEALAMAAGRTLVPGALGLLQNKANLLLGVHGEIEKLSNTLGTIQAVLADAEKKQVENETVRSWLERLESIAYDADDVLDEFLTEVAHGPEGDSCGGTKLVYDCCFPCFTGRPNPVLFRLKIARRIKAINNKLDKISEEQNRLNLIILAVTSQSQTTTVRQETNSLPEEYVFGREEEREYIIGKMLESDGEAGPSSSSHVRGGGAKVSLVPIIGMGGIGKTTLAQAVFNDKRVEKHFTFRKWVSVGEENFNASYLIKTIIRKPLDNPTLDDLHKELRDMLQNVRFLIVLDDVWSENGVEWEKLWRPLTLGSKGGKVLITTRSQKVASVKGTMTPTNLLMGLPGEACWSMFEKYAFVDGDSDIHHKLKGIGLEIVKKLKGVPLAVKAVGGFLRHELNEEKWRSVLENEIRTVDEQDILPILRSSYQHLPPHLKQCFAYCSVFPKDYVFDKHTLIQIWMAQGFIRPHENN